MSIGREPAACPVCGNDAEAFGTATVLRRHQASFRRCLHCGCVFAEDPFWLPEAYEKAIAEQDIGLVGRNLLTANATTVVIRTLFRSARRFVDFGAGTGMFVRLMRDAGYDFRYFDEHGPNLFAPGHETKLDGSERFDLATGFEVLEHLRSPGEELRPLASVSDNLFLSTECLPEPAPSLDSWWYYALEAGQHITFYTPRSLDLLGEQLGLRRVSSRGYHLFTRRRVPSGVVALATSGKVSHHLSRFARRPSLLPADYERLSGRPLR